MRLDKSYHFPPVRQPAPSKRSLALRTRLATGLPFRSARNFPLHLQRSVCWPQQGSAICHPAILHMPGGRSWRYGGTLPLTSIPPAAKVDRFAASCSRRLWGRREQVEFSVHTAVRLGRPEKDIPCSSARSPCSAARLPLRGPRLCAPASRRVCLYRYAGAPALVRTSLLRWRRPNYMPPGHSFST